jgi:cytochrome c biogenesis protein CcmG/thiol:disulfide interchange protein DsbE
VFVPVLAFLGLLTYGLVRSAPARLEAGERIPDFSLETLDGSDVLTRGDFTGHPVVINFWASWCVPCKQEARLLEKTYEAYRDEGVTFLGVNIKDAPADAQDFLDRYGIEYQIVRDPNEVLAGVLGVTGIPETFFIDDAGTFVSTVSGDPLGERGGVPKLGPISEAELTTNIDILVRRASAQ